MNREAKRKRRERRVKNKLQARRASLRELRAREKRELESQKLVSQRARELQELVGPVQTVSVTRRVDFGSGSESDQTIICKTPEEPVPSAISLQNGFDKSKWQIKKEGDK